MANCVRVNRVASSVEGACGLRDLVESWSLGAVPHSLSSGLLNPPLRGRGELRRSGRTESTMPAESERRSECETVKSTLTLHLG